LLFIQHTSKSFAPSVAGVAVGMLAVAPPKSDAGRLNADEACEPNSDIFFFLFSVQKKVCRMRDILLRSVSVKYSVQQTNRFY
jgi:hypothetical protein